MASAEVVAHGSSGDNKHMMSLQFSASARGTRNVRARLVNENAFSPERSIVYNPTQYYVPGTGGPAVSTADYYHMDGMYGFRPYDLLTMGDEGASIAAERGRYIWLVSPDHPEPTGGWRGGRDFMAGYSDDPGVFPKKLERIWRYLTPVLLNGLEQWAIYQMPILVYNPDDPTNPFHIHGEGQRVGGSARDGGEARQHEDGYFKTADLRNLTLVGPSHQNTVFADWSSFQTDFRRASPNNWSSIGLMVQSEFGGAANFWTGRWTSTDGGQTYEPSGVAVNVARGNSVAASTGDFQFEFNGQEYIVAKEELWSEAIPDLREGMPGSVEDAGAVQVSVQVSMFPVDADGSVQSSPDIIRLSDGYDDTPSPAALLGILGDNQNEMTAPYPGPGFLQATPYYLEDGVLHIYALHGFFPGSSLFGLGTGTYAQGGGLWQQFVDHYVKIIDGAQASTAAPIGLQASCAAGTVTLTWYDVLPVSGYRVYRGESSSGPWTLVNDFSGASATDTPTAGQRWWYRVFTVTNGVEQKARIVSIYASNATAFVNEHIERVLADGALLSSIDTAWLSTCDAWLTTNDAHKYLQMWADPSFGHRTVDGKLRVYCLGTTRLPRGGDFNAHTTNTTYSATGLNGVAPAWVNSVASAHGYFGGGRLNSIRRKVEITAFAVYQKPGTSEAGFLATDEFRGMSLSHTSGTPGNVSFMLTDDPASGLVTATSTVSAVSATAPHVAMGVYDGADVIAYCDGIAGTPDPDLPPNANLANPHTLKGKQGHQGTTPFLASGVTGGSKYNISTQTYNFNSNQALFTCGALGWFEVGFDPALVSSFTDLYQTRMGL